MIITIDGPAASGKSTIAKLLAEKLGYYYLYTGMLYRAVAYIALQELHKSIDDLQSLDGDEIKFVSNITYKYVNGQPKIFFNNEDISTQLFTSDISEASSVISADKNIRKALIDIQRNVSKQYDIITEGRDCGSNVFPNADYKFFLTADLKVRAQRAFHDSRRKNTKLTLQQIEESLNNRDKRDRERKIAPLVVPKGAIIIDNSELTLEETLDKFISYIK